MSAAVDLIHSTRRLVGGIPGIGATRTVPNTLDFLARSWLQWQGNGGEPDLPAARPSLAMAAQVALDEFLLGLMSSPRAHPQGDDYTRVGREMRDALDLYQAEGWIADPAGYHRTPPAAPVHQRTPRVSRGLRFEHLEWESGFAPRPAEPGGDRWTAFEANRTAHAYLVRSVRPTSSWLVCIHGFGMGSPLTDFSAFGARRLARDLGVNLIFPVLPLHGPRKTGRMSGGGMISFEMMNVVHGMAQAVWDIRSLVSWLQREEGAEQLGSYGISLGGYAAALLSALDPRIGSVIAGIPVTDFPDVFRHHAPAHLRRRAEEHSLLGYVPNTVHRVISPLAMRPLTPPSGRFIYAAVGDRLCTPHHAYRLWLHWNRPRIEWLQGAHVSSALPGRVDAFVDAAIAESRMGDPVPAAERPAVRRAV